MSSALRKSFSNSVGMISHTLKVLKSLGYPWQISCLPGFQVKGEQIEVLSEPKEFYNTLLHKCQTAERRIVIASLYLGTGCLEAGLVSAIQKRLTEKEGLSVSVLLDCLRGSRGKENSRTMLLPLLQHHPNSCQVSLYHTPKLRGLLRRILPDRYNELVGLQHMKLYVFDDDLIITGANLSQDYFTNRQDRYMVVSNCRPLADFAEGLCERVSDFSFRLDKDNEIQMNSTWSKHFYRRKLGEFVARAKEHVWSFYSSISGSLTEGATDTDTIIFPFLEMGQFDIHQESIVTQKLLESCPEESEVRIATGYFNLTEAYAKSITDRSKARFQLLMAHPTANGFYQAKGPAGGIPKGYSELAGRFYDFVHSKNQQHRINLLEYARDGWTFHAKGLWYSSNSQTLPSLTLIGSSNFGERSVHRDLECQFLVVTSNQELRMALQKEYQSLFNQSSSYTSVERRRKLPLWARLLLTIKTCF